MAAVSRYLSDDSVIEWTFGYQPRSSGTGQRASPANAIFAPRVTEPWRQVSDLPWTGRRPVLRRAFAGSVLRAPARQDADRRMSMVFKYACLRLARYTG